MILFGIVPVLALGEALRQVANGASQSDRPPGWFEAIVMALLAVGLALTGVFIHEGASPGSRIYRPKDSDVAFRVLGIFVMCFSVGLLAVAVALAVSAMTH